MKKAEKVHCALLISPSSSYTANPIREASDAIIRSSFALTKSLGVSGVMTSLAHLPIKRPGSTFRLKAITF